MNDDRPPAVIVHPSEILRDELEARHMTPDDLAETMCWYQYLVDDLLAGRVPITNFTADALERALGLSARFWLNLQATYDRRTKEFNGG